MSKHPRRKKSFILIEVLISTALFVMLLVAIFGIFWRTSKTNAALNRLRIANEQMLVTQARLQSLFAGVSFKKAIRPYFFVESDKNFNRTSLVFTITKKFQTDANFSNTTLLKLYVEDNQLVLATFPHLKTEVDIPTIMQKEALLSDVKDFQVEFFLAPESQQEIKTEDEDQAKKPPTGKWVSSWSIEYDCAPSLIRLHMEREKYPSCTLWIFLPEMVNTIVYDKG